MSILDLFTLKKDLTQTVKPDYLSALDFFIALKIKEQAKETGLKGIEKFNIVKAKVIEYIHIHFKSNNKIVQWIINTFIIEPIEGKIQSIYDTLKEKVSNL